MIIGSRAVIIDIDCAKKILEAVRTPWVLKRIKLLQERDLLDTVNELADAVKEIEGEEG
jgi:hypothetical protein